MNPSFGAGSTFRFWASHGLHGVVYGGDRVHSRPNKFHHNNIAARHFSISDTRHHAIAGNVLGKAVHKNFLNGVKLHRVVLHQFPLPHEEMELSLVSASEHNKIRHCIAPDKYRPLYQFPVWNTFQFAGATSGDKAATVSKPPAPSVAANSFSFAACLHSETAAVTDLFHRQRMTVADNSVRPNYPAEQREQRQHREHDQSITHEVVQ